MRNAVQGLPGAHFVLGRGGGNNRSADHTGSNGFTTRGFGWIGLRGIARFEQHVKYFRAFFVKNSHRIETLVQPVTILGKKVEFKVFGVGTHPHCTDANGHFRILKGTFAPQPAARGATLYIAGVVTSGLAVGKNQTAPGCTVFVLEKSPHPTGEIIALDV